MPLPENTASQAGRTSTQADNAAMAGLRAPTSLSFPRLWWDGPNGFVRQPAFKVVRQRLAEP